jgi:hypothetical protein
MASEGARLEQFHTPAPFRAPTGFRLGFRGHTTEFPGFRGQLGQFPVLSLVLNRHTEVPTILARPTM